MLANVINEMPTLVENAVFEILNGTSYHPHERNEEAFTWLMKQLGIDKDWFRQHGVDIDMALRQQTKTSSD